MSQSFNVSSTDESLMNNTTCEPERIKLYRNIVQETLQNIHCSITVDEFVGFFENVPLSRKSAIPQIYETMSKYMTSHIMEQVEEHIRESNLSNQCAELEKIIENNAANKGQKAWRPSRDVNRTLLSGRIELKKREMKEKLEKMVLEKEVSVQTLKEDVVSDRSKAKQIEEIVAKIKLDLDAVNQGIDKCMEVSEEGENMKQLMESSNGF